MFTYTVQTVHGCILEKIDVTNYQCAVRHNGGSGGLPPEIFVATCSEIDSNAIWLKKLQLYNCLDIESQEESTKIFRSSMR